MVVVTALIDAPGLGAEHRAALERVNVGAAFDAGLAIVVLAIVLDRVTTARPRRAAATGGRIRRLAALVAVAVAAARRWSPARACGAEFPDGCAVLLRRAGQRASPGGSSCTGTTPPRALKNSVSAGLLNPLETVLVTTPVVAVRAGRAGLRRADQRLARRPCIAGARRGRAGRARASGSTPCRRSPPCWWRPSLTMVIGVLLGVLLRPARPASPAALRPLLDAAQTMPSFVYLLPAVALFGASRFTAIVAAVIYAVPPVVRLVERGVRDVPPTVVEAAASAGSTPRPAALEGAAADGPRRPAARREPGHRHGPRDGRRGRPGRRRRARLRRGRRLLPARGLRQGPGRRLRDRPARHPARPPHARISQMRRELGHEISDRCGLGRRWSWPSPRCGGATSDAGEGDGRRQRRRRRARSTSRSTRGWGTRRTRRSSPTCWRRSSATRSRRRTSRRRSPGRASRPVRST